MEDAALSLIHADAREFGLHDRQGPWRLGLLVARNVADIPHGGDRRSSSFARNLNGKISASDFAKLSGTSTKRVMKYFRAWNEAAKAGYVPNTSELSPGDELKSVLLVERLPDWDKFYEKERPKKSNIEPPQWPVMEGSRRAPVPEKKFEPYDIEYEPESIADASKSGWCRIEKAPKFIRRIKYSLNEILGAPYHLNTADLAHLKQVLEEALEEVRKYEPLQTEESSKTIEHVGIRRTV